MEGAIRAAGAFRSGTRSGCSVHIYTPWLSAACCGHIGYSTEPDCPQCFAHCSDLVGATAVRYRDDGTAPTSSLGMTAAAAGCFQYSAALTAIQFISVSTTTTLDVS